MYINESEKAIIKAVLDDLLLMPYEKLINIMGDITIQRATTLRKKIEMDEYCTINNIPFEKLTADDYLKWSETKQDRKEAEFDEYEEEM